MRRENNREFVFVLKDWLQHQGASYKRSDLANKIGITPRHLNRVLQGTRNLSPEAQARAVAAMASMSVRDPGLRGWLKQHGLTVAQFATQLGKPLKTVEDWVYRGKIPSRKNCALVYSVTGLRNYDPQHVHRALAGVIDKANAEQVSTAKVSARQRARSATANVQRLIRNLQDLARGDKAGRDEFRQRVSGSDIGYLRSILAALLDEEQLEDWKRMSSYEPRLGGAS